MSDHEGLDDRTRDIGGDWSEEISECFGSLRGGTEVGHYTLAGHIGSGGMGEVYLANDSRLDRKVALKFLSPKLASDAEFRGRFETEAKAVAQINHPNVVTVYEVGDYQGAPFIAMELLSGRSLAQLLSVEKLSLDNVIDTSIQISQGVKEAHDAGIIHRDLKPANIIATDEGRVKILDFGLARRVGIDSVDQHGRIEGTISYMSPEQVSGSELTTATDIFSFGVVFYELLTGRRPFDRDDSTSVIYAILHEDPIPPCEVSPESPGWADVFNLRLLSKTPSERFSDMGEVVEFLDAVRGNGKKAAASKSSHKRRRSATVVNLRNLSGDQSWNYFCEGFTEDLVREISRRADLIVSAEPPTSERSDIRTMFRKCRSDYVVSGTLMKLGDNIKLSLSCYGDGGDNLFFAEDFKGTTEDLFSILSLAAVDASTALAAEAGSSSVTLDSENVTDVTAYDYYLKGKNYYQTNKPEDLEFAESMFMKALEIDKNFALAHTGLSDVYAFQYMAYYDRSPERIAMAEDRARKALKIHPALPEAHRSLGRYYMNLRDFDKAEESFLKAIAISPKYAVGYRTLAWLAELRGNHAEALRWAKMTLSLAPTDLETLLLISLVYMDEKKYPLAMATLSRAIELGPDYGRAYYSLGEVYFKLGVLDKALENLELAAKFKGDPNCYVLAAAIHMINDDLDLAESEFRKAIDEGCMAIEGFYGIGFVEKLRGNEKVAMEHFRKAVNEARECEKNDPNNHFLISMKAMALASAGEIDEATEVLERLAAEASEKGDILHNIARAHAIMGNEDLAENFRRLALVKHAGPTVKELTLDPYC